MSNSPSTTLVKGSNSSYLRSFLSEETATNQGIGFLPPLISKRKRKEPRRTGATYLELGRVPPTAVRELKEINPFYRRAPRKLIKMYDYYMPGKFNLDVYKKYPDLINAFKTDDISYINHFLTIGFYEKRVYY